MLHAALPREAVAFREMVLAPLRTQSDRPDGYAGTAAATAVHEDENRRHQQPHSDNHSTPAACPRPIVQLVATRLSPIVSFFCVTRTVLAPALADAAAASQPACPPPTTTTSTPVGTSCLLPITPALEPAPAPAPALLVDDIMRSAPFVTVAALPADDSLRGCLGRTAADGTPALPRLRAALAAPRRLLLATTCMLLPEENEWDVDGTGGSTKAAESGQCAARRTAATTTATRRGGTEGDVADKGHDEEDEDEIATGLSRRFRVLLCLMGCPTHSAVLYCLRFCVAWSSHGGTIACCKIHTPSL